MKILEQIHSIAKDSQAATCNCFGCIQFREIMKLCSEYKPPTVALETTAAEIVRVVQQSNDSPLNLTDVVKQHILQRSARNLYFSPNDQAHDGAM